MTKPTIWVSDQVQHKPACTVLCRNLKPRILKIWEYVEEEMYYPCSENKDADQLRGYREADLRLCFRPCKLLVFSRTGSIKFDNATK